MDKEPCDNKLGEDFDNRLVKHFCDEFKRKFKADLNGNIKAIKRLKVACETAKRTLSNSATASIELDSLHDGIDFVATITRARFEELCMDLFRKCLDSVDKALLDSGLSKGEIHDVVLVGGSSRIPKIQNMMTDYFNGKELCKSLNPDEAIAYGAAVQAAILSGCSDEQIKDVLLLDVCPLSLSIKTSGNIATVLIPRNTTIPAKKTQTFSTYADNQTAVDIEICEGERSMFEDNHFLGKFHLDGIPAARRGEPKIEVTYDLDANGILTVSANVKEANIQKSITITNDNGRISKDEIDRLVKEAEKFKAEDDENRERIEAKNELENYIYSTQTTFLDNKDINLPKKDVQKIKETVEEGRKWLDENPSGTKKDYVDKKESMTDIISPIVSKMYKTSGGGGGGEDLD